MTVGPPDGPLVELALRSKEDLARSHVAAYGALEVLIGKAAMEQHRLRAERSPQTRAAVEAAARTDAYAQVAADALNVCGTKEGFLAAVRDALDAYPAPASHPGTAGYQAWQAAVTQAVLAAAARDPRGTGCQAAGAKRPAPANGKKATAVASDQDADEAGPVPGPLAEARAREHGTRPLPQARGRRARTAAPGPEQEAI